MEFSVSVNPLTGEDDQVLQGIVRTVAVTVVDDLTMQDGTPERLFSQPAVNEYPFAGPRVTDVNVDLAPAYASPPLPYCVRRPHY